MDQRQRELEREASAGDLEAAAAALRERERAGELTNEHVSLAARLGHGAALALCPSVEPIERWWRDHAEAALAQAGALERTIPALVAADWAEHVLPPDGPRSEGDELATDAIAAIRAWSACPCDVHSSYVRHACDAISSRLPAAASVLAAGAAATATLVVAKTPLVGAAVRRPAEKYASIAAQMALRAKDEFLAIGSEGMWQRLRLADHVLGEI